MHSFIWILYKGLKSQNIPDIYKKAKTMIRRVLKAQTHFFLLEICFFSLLSKSYQSYFYTSQIDITTFHGVQPPRMGMTELDCEIAGVETQSPYQFKTLSDDAASALGRGAKAIMERHGNDLRHWIMYTILSYVYY